MKITGIDLSFRHCGVATIRYERNDSVELTLLRQKVLETKFQGRDWHGLLQELKQMRWLIDELLQVTEDSDCVLVEIPTMGGKPDAASVRTAGICYGVISGVQHQSKHLFRYIQPKSLKAWSGSTKNKKEHVKAKVLDKLGRTVISHDDNIIDALGLCLLKCDELSYEYHITQQPHHSKSEPIEGRGNPYSSSNLQSSFEFLQSGSNRPEGEARD